MISDPLLGANIIKKRIKIDSQNRVKNKREKTENVKAKSAASGTILLPPRTPPPIPPSFSP